MEQQTDSPESAECGSMKRERMAVLYILLIYFSLVWQEEECRDVIYRAWWHGLEGEAEGRRRPLNMKEQPDRDRDWYQNVRNLRKPEMKVRWRRGKCGTWPENEDQHINGEGKKSCSAQINPKMADNRNLICVTKTRFVSFGDKKRPCAICLWNICCCVRPGERRLKAWFGPKRQEGIRLLLNNIWSEGERSICCSQ